MSAHQGGPPTFPIRLWLAAALMVTVLAPAATMIAVAARVTPTATVEPAILEELVDNVARWDDVAWQMTATAKLAALEMDALLLDGAGREVFRTGGVPSLPGTDATAAGAIHGTTYPVRGELFDRPRHLQRLVILDREASATGAASARPIGTVFVFAPVELAGWPGPWLVPAAGLLSLVVVLTAITWLVGSAVLRPLDAVRRAADRIAAGSLAVDLPRSAVREVAELAGAFGTMRDALRRAADAEEQLDAERRLFIGAIVHDLRTPLFALRGYLDGLTDGVAATPEKAAHYLAVCRHQAATLERRVADLFAYARIEFLEEAARRERLDLGAVLRETVETFLPRAAERTTALRLVGPPMPCWVEGDTHLLARAVENVLDNALSHTPTGGEVRVAWGPVAGRVVVTVTDTGPGIAPKDLPNLFTPLYRGEASRNRQTGGAGLGLTIARRILRSHDGDLVAANADNGGAVFTLSLPAVDPAPSRMPRPEAITT